MQLRLKPVLVVARGTHLPDPTALPPPRLPCSGITSTMHVASAGPLLYEHATSGKGLGTTFQQMLYRHH